jgi:hypothetical protein
MSRLAEADRAELVTNLRRLIGAHADVAANDLEPFICDLVERAVADAEAHARTAWDVHAEHVENANRIQLHRDAVSDERIRRAQAEALREGAQELWRVFLRLPHTPSPLGDYVQRRVQMLRARAAVLAPGDPR